MRLQRQEMYKRLNIIKNNNDCNTIKINNDLVSATNVFRTKNTRRICFSIILTTFVHFRLESFHVVAGPSNILHLNPFNSRERLLNMRIKGTTMPPKMVEHGSIA